MDTSMASPTQYCSGCDTELYVGEVEHPAFQGMCQDCDTILRDPINHIGGTNMANTFKVFDNNTPKKDVFFKLAPRPAGGINLVAVQPSGVAYASGNVLSIMPDGRILLAGGVNKTLGLQINPSTGKVVTY